jgi:solute carrier family 9B (sodium/hydrogen exchanger), member 1/2
MIDFMQRGKGTDKGIPTLVLAASSVDDVFVIVLFTILLGMAGGVDVHWARELAKIPLSVILGIMAGIIPGYVLYRLFLRYDLRPPRRTLLVLGSAIALLWTERALEGVVPVAGLLGVMAIGFIILENEEAIAHQISYKLKHLWVFAELVLFVLVGAEVNVSVAWQAGLAGIVLVAGGLAARGVGTWISLLGTDLSPGEKLFAVVAYVPKATVQAAIGAVPVAAGVQGGEMILAVAVMSIVFTAPLGAIGIKVLGERTPGRGEAAGLPVQGPPGKPGASPCGGAATKQARRHRVEGHRGEGDLDRRSGRGLAGSPLHPHRGAQALGDQGRRYPGNRSHPIPEFPARKPSPQPGVGNPLRRIGRLDTPRPAILSPASS